VLGSPKFDRQIAAVHGRRTWKGIKNEVGVPVSSRKLPPVSYRKLATIIMRSAERPSWSRRNSNMM
jgi:hypothetical protein